ncbi:MAG: M28 family peptidase [Lautropia sp.]
MSEADVMSAMAIENVRKHVDHICTEIPSRLAGSENGRRMAHYSRDVMSSLGLSTVVHEFPAVVSFPGVARFRVTSPVDLAIEANTLGHSLKTLPEGLSGQLVWAGDGGYKDYETRDVTGKIILSELSYSPARHEKQRIAGEKGAIGAVMMNWGHDTNDAVPFGSVKPVWGNPTPQTWKTEMPTIPCIGIARTAGLKLREMAEREKVMVHLATEVENGWKPIQITVADMTRGPDQDFVLVGGHQDSWFGEAATDNAAGNACFFELARVFSKYKDQLRRGIVFGFWTAHETGTMAGSSWFVDQYWDRLRRHAVAYMQIDQPSCFGTTEWKTSSNAELKEFHQSIEKRLLGKIPYRWHRAVKTGDNSFFGLGIPSFHGEGGFTADELKASANATLGWWHHSLECYRDKLDWDYFALHLKLYAAYVWELCTAPVLPYRFGSVADQFVGRLEELASSGRTVGLDGALAQAREFQAVAARFDRAAIELRARFDQGAGNEAEADAVNRCMKRLSRLLVPLQSTAKGTYGHDPYGYTPQTTMIPRLYDIPKLDRLAADDPQRWMLETGLRRERNLVADALDDACTMIGDTLAGLR